MKKAIYLIENLVNHKRYIGQSKNPRCRWKSHCNKRIAERDKTLIGKAIQKHGVDSFRFSVIGWFEDYNEKEKYYIEQYNSLAPNGYNILKGGEEPPLWVGENHPMAKITKEKARLIQKDMMEDKLFKQDIEQKYGISSNIYRHIREGSSWHDDNLQYPLGLGDKEKMERIAEKIINDLRFTNLTQREIGEKYGLQRSTVTMINTGKNHRRDDVVYPIRTKK